MSFRIVPYKSYASQTASLLSAPSAPGIHDTLRANLGEAFPAPVGTATVSSSSSSSASYNDGDQVLQSTHPLEARLINWRATQESLRMETLRRQFGIAEPVRRGMEMRIVSMSEWRPSCLDMVAMTSMGLGRVHSDVLAGRDCELGWEDVFGAGREFREVPGFHAEMEARMRMNW